MTLQSNNNACHFRFVLSALEVFKIPQKATFNVNIIAHLYLIANEKQEHQG